MPLDIADFQLKFLEDVIWFDAHDFKDSDFDPPNGRFDDAIKMAKIDDPGQYHDGIDAVKRYFTKDPPQGHGKSDQAWFSPIPTVPPSVPDFQIFDLPGGEQLGVVSGTADCIYRTVDPDRTNPRRIVYSFTYKVTNGEWKAIHLWGKYI
jgi:hypothetical protein